MEIHRVYLIFFRKKSCIFTPLNFFLYLTHKYYRMKFCKQALLSGFVFIAIIITVVCSSCEQNICNNVTCFNGGSCNGGVCQCPLGYEGPQCQTLSITRYLGTYIGYSACNGPTQLFDTASIVAAPGIAINAVAVTLYSMKPKVIYGYVSSNESTYSIIPINNDSLSSGNVVNDRTFTITLQNDSKLSILTYSIFENPTDTAIDHCSFLGVN